MNLFRDRENAEYTKRRPPTECLRLPSASSARWTLVLLFFRTLRTLSAHLGVRALQTRLATGNTGACFPRTVLAMMYARRSTIARPIGRCLVELRGSVLATNGGPMHGSITTTAAPGTTEMQDSRTCHSSRRHCLPTGIAKAIRCCNNSRTQDTSGTTLSNRRRTIPTTDQSGRRCGHGRPVVALPVELVVVIRQYHRSYVARGRHPPTS